VPPPNFDFFAEENEFSLRQGLEIKIQAELDRRGIREWRIRELVKETIAKEIEIINKEEISQIVMAMERRVRKYERKFGSLDEALHFLEHFMK